MIFIFFIWLVLILDWAVTIYVIITDDEFGQNEAILSFALSFARIIWWAYLFTLL